MTEQEIREKIIVALDVDTLPKALEMVRSLSTHVSTFKIGLEFISSMLVTNILAKTEEDALKDYNMKKELFALLDHKVFWDNKFNDIPNTVCGAAREIAKLNLKMFNVHASSGIEAMKSAVENKGNSMVMAVTVLTSIDEENCQLIYGIGVKAKVLQFARDALMAGVDGLICSPQELEMLAKYKEFSLLKKVIPGIRPAWAVAGDQKRIMTPAQAVKAGADYLVIGRPITKPPAEIASSVEAVNRIIHDISVAFSAPVIS